MTPEQQRNVIHTAVNVHMDVERDVDSVRAAWWKAECYWCDDGWYTTGCESVVQDAAYNHIQDKHPDVWRML